MVVEENALKCIFAFVYFVCSYIINKKIKDIYLYDLFVSLSVSIFVKSLSLTLKKDSSMDVIIMDPYRGTERESTTKVFL